MSALDNLNDELTWAHNDDGAALHPDGQPKQHSAPAASQPRAFAINARFAHLSVTDKIKIFSIANFTVLVLAALAMILGMQQLSSRYETHDQMAAATLQAAKLVTRLTQAHDASERYVMTRTPADLDKAQVAIRQSQVLVGGLQGHGLILEPASIETISRLARQIGANSEPLTQSDIRSLVSGGDELANQADSLATRLQAASDDSESAGFAFFYAFLAIFGLIGLCGAAIGALGTRFLSRDISQAIGLLTASMKKLSTGDKHIDVPYEDRADEIGDMARALDVFRRAAWHYEKLSAEKIEEAKIKLQLQVEAERERETHQSERAQLMADLANRIEQTVGEVASGVAAASSQLKATSSAMQKSAEMSSDQAGRVAKSMQEASSGATAAAAASDEFAMSIGEISRQAATSAELARQASESADLADVKMSTLSDSAAQVGQIVELIQSIARRTNLLALNASIEAARGGEAGRGFAVVASEVKELAAQTSRATEEVAGQIRAMQDSTHDSVKALRQIGEQVEQLETTAISIASAVDQQSVAGQDLARSIDLAARSSGEVSASITKVRETALATGAAASQVLGSATDLEGQAATLRNQVDSFLRQVRESAASTA